MPVCQLNIILSLRISHIKASWPGMAFTMPQISALSGKFPAMRRQLHFLPLRKAQLGHDISKPVPGSPITHIRVPLPTFVALLPYLPSPARTKKESRRNLFLQDPHSKKAASYSPASHCSTIGASGLNFSVRNGKRWNPAAITTVIWLFDGLGTSKHNQDQNTSYEPHGIHARKRFRAISSARL